MDTSFDKFWESAHHMLDSFFARLPSLILGIIVFVLFYLLSIFVSRMIRTTTTQVPSQPGSRFRPAHGRGHDPVWFSDRFLGGCALFQAADLIKILGIGGVAIGFAFQNILQNFLAGLLLLWAEPFRIGDEIKLDSYEGSVEEIQTRATIIKTYDGRRIVIPNADLFTHSVTINTALDSRRWEYDLNLKGVQDLDEMKSLIVRTVNKVPGVLSDPSPEVLALDLTDPDSNTVKMRVLWWTKAPRQHEMLTSYDKVLSAIGRMLSQAASEHARAA